MSLSAAALSLAPLDPLLITVRYKGVAIGAKWLTPSHPRPLGSRRRRPPTFVVGSGSRADAPVDPRLIGSRDHVLVAHAPCGWQITPTAAMAYATTTVAGTSPYDDARSRAEVRCGAISIDVESVPWPTPMRLRPLAGIRREATSFVALALTALAALWLWSLPRDGRLLAVGFDDARRLSAFRIIPTVAPPWAPDRRSHVAPTSPRGADPAAEEGPRIPQRAPATITAVTRAPLRHRVGKPPLQVSSAQAGLLPLLAQLGRTSLASVFASDDALAASADQRLAGLLAPSGTPGIPAGVVGSGASGAGTGHRTVGSSRLDVIGGCGGGRPCTAGDAGHVDRVARLDRRHPVRVVTVDPGRVAHLSGRYDRDAIRRVVRQHLNEVRACYERALPRSPTLAGRLVVRFVIAGTGQVVASIAESSTLSDVRVESCVASAVARWTFPGPKDAGVAVVSYPFVFATAGGG